MVSSLLLATDVVSVYLLHPSTDRVLRCFYLPGPTWLSDLKSIVGAIQPGTGIHAYAPLSLTERWKGEVEASPLPYAKCDAFPRWASSYAWTGGDCEYCGHLPFFTSDYHSADCPKESPLYRWHQC